MRLVHRLGLATLAGYLLLPSPSEAQPWTCDNRPEALHTVAQYAGAGSAVLFVSEVYEVARLAVKKKAAAILALVSAAYPVIKDSCDGSHASLCKLIFCTEGHRETSQPQLILVGRGKAFQNLTEVQKRLDNANIGNFNKSSLLQEARKLSHGAKIKDFLPSGKSLAPGETDEIMKLLGRCPGSQAARLLTSSSGLSHCFQ